MEEAVALANEISPDGMITVIEDRRNFAMTRNFSLQLLRAVLPIIQTYYPERTFRIYIINPEFMLKMVWNVVTPFLDKRTLAKIRVLKSETELL
jgi:hypothetical protein